MKYKFDYSTGFGSGVHDKSDMRSLVGLMRHQQKEIVEQQSKLDGLARLVSRLERNRAGSPRTVDNSPSNVSLSLWSDKSQKYVSAKDKLREEKKLNRSSLEYLSALVANDEPNGGRSGSPTSPYGS